jgi:acyl dehydratase
MPTVIESKDALLAAQSLQLGTTQWMEITQERVNQFAEATNDHQWIHVDVERAKTGPFGGTVVHGFLTLSLVAYLRPQLLDVKYKMALNYGLEKVRFPSPLLVGKRIRGNGEVVNVEVTKDGAVQATVRVTVEIEGGDKPACVADTVTRYYF